MSERGTARGARRRRPWVVVWALCVVGLAACGGGGHVGGFQPDKEKFEGTTMPGEGERPTPEPEEPVRPSSPFGELRGRIAFARNPIPPDVDGNEIYVLDLADGSLEQLTHNSVPDWNPNWSPDWQSMVFTSYQDDNYDIWVMGADGSGQVKRVALPAWDDYPVWSPDGSQFAFSSTGETAGEWNSEIFVGSSTEDIRRLTVNTGRDEWPSWAPDGEWLADSCDEDGDMDVYLFTADGGRSVQWTDDPGEDEQPDWSPDGEWIAFLRKTEDINQDGALDEWDTYGNIWVGRRDGSEFRQLTFDHLAAHPAWAPNGQYIVFSHYKDLNENGQVEPEDASDLWVIPAEGGEPIVLTDGPEVDWGSDWAP